MSQIEKLKEITQKLVLFFAIRVVNLDYFNFNMEFHLTRGS